MLKIFEKLLPWGTRRRQDYQLVVTALNIIRYQGLRVFWLKARREISSRATLRLQDPYLHWIRQNEPGPNALPAQEQQAATLHFNPLISLLLPLDRESQDQLKATIDSVMRQTFSHWELCLVADFRRKAELESFRGDPRIKIKIVDLPTGDELPQYQDLSRALSLTEGEYISLLNEGDQLAPWALFEAVTALNASPETDWLYSDADRLSVNNQRVQPFFKPDWSPDYFLSFMYTGRLALYRKRTVELAGGFRPQFGSAQEYDLALRLMEKKVRIEHLPRVLYHHHHRRYSDSSNPSQPAYIPEDGRRALADYTQRSEPGAAVDEGPWPGSFRFRRRIEGNPLVSIIIPSKNKPEVLRVCLESIFQKTDYPDYEIIIVDNQSSDPALLDYYRTLQSRSNLFLLSYNKPFSYSSINNYAAAEAHGEHLLLLNNDTEVITPEWLRAMLEHSQREEVGVVGARLQYPDDTLQHCGVVLGMDTVCGHAFSRSCNHHQQGDRPDLICNFSAVTGACLMIKKQLFMQTGGLDEALTVEYNDIDLCLKVVEKGYRVVYTPYARLYHYEALTRGQHDNLEKMRRLEQETALFRKRWQKMIDRGDPFYNPNLSLVSKDFRISPQRVDRSNWKADKP